MVGSAVFGLPALIAGLLGRFSTPAVVIAGAVMGVIIACFAEVASRFSEAGGPYLYARTAFGRLIGILVGWTLYLSQAAAPAANANLFVVYLAEFWPRAQSPVPRFLGLSLLIGLLTAINLLGVRQGSTQVNLITIAKFLPLLVVITAGALLMLVHPAASTVQVEITQNSWLKALVLLVFAYGGFESGLVPMSEAKNPRRDAAFSLLASLAICTLVYALVQWVVVGVLGAHANTARPLAEVARAAIGVRGAALVSLGALVSIYGLLSAKLLSMPRVTFALAEGGDFPQVFRTVSSRFRTPWFSILVYSAAVWTLAVIGNFTWNVTLSVMARLFYYGVVCAALPVLRRRDPGGATFRLPGGPVFAVLGLLICVLLATQADRSNLLIVFGVVAAALVNWVWVRTRSTTG